MKLPRILIAGTASGSGKTTVTCGILQALKQRGYQITASKCGPDYIDPMFHESVLHISSNNLDSFFCDHTMVNEVLANHAKDAEMAVIEGVMGYYDGMALDATKGSSYDIARITDTPVILVLNCKGMGFTIVPILKGLIEFQEDSKIQGVILNGISKSLCERVKPIIEQQLNIVVIGHIPKLEKLRLESRHLGLVTPLEIPMLQEQMKYLGNIVEEHLDIERLIQMANKTVDLPVREQAIHVKDNIRKIRIGIAYDQAFCFYYKDNLRYLERLGCELVYFSPLKDTELPQELHGLLLGGGYPELHAKELARNQKMKKSIAKALEGGMPCLAECGGFMYLQQEMEGADGNKYDMVGYLEGTSLKTQRLSRFGYVELEALENNFLQDKGDVICGHEFHYWDSTNVGNAYMAKKPTGNRSWKCYQIKDQVLAGFPHLYYLSNPTLACRFVQACERRQGE